MSVKDKNGNELNINDDVCQENNHDVIGSVIDIHNGEIAIRIYEPHRKALNFTSQAFLSSVWIKRIYRSQKEYTGKMPAYYPLELHIKLVELGANNHYELLKDFMTILKSYDNIHNSLVQDEYANIRSQLKHEAKELYEVCEMSIPKYLRR